MNSQVETAEVVEPQMAVAVRPPQHVSLFGATEPVQVIENATKVATALKGVIQAQKLISNISGKEYPRCEAWTLLGTMLGVFPVLCWSRPLEDGWEARVEARTRDGAVVGAAEAECLTTERNWSNRDDFAVRSMAQTRATAKALRMPLGFVMTLAGYEATPAEEMVFDSTGASGRNARPEPEPPRNSNTRGMTGGNHNSGASGEPESQSAKRGTDNNAASRSSSPGLQTAAQGTANEPARTVSPSKTLSAATVEQRDKMIEELLKVETQAAIQDYAQKAGILMPTEGLLDWPLRFVPTTQSQMKLLVAAMRDFYDGGDAVKAFTNPDPPEKPKEEPKANGKKSERQHEPWMDVTHPILKGKVLGAAERKYLFGLWANYKVELTYEDRTTGETKKKNPASLAKDKVLRAALDDAGVSLGFTRKDGDQ